jgi:transcriptional regulator with XRE-family HTH domain
MANSQRALRMMREFGIRLRAARISAGYESAEDLAADVGSEPHRYRKYERGEAFPPLDILELLSVQTGKSLDFLILGKSPKG